jgi:hypothetical protein
MTTKAICPECGKEISSLTANFNGDMGLFLDSDGDLQSEEWEQDVTAYFCGACDARLYALETWDDAESFLKGELVLRRKGETIGKVLA